MKKLVLFGIRSTNSVEFEETCYRAGWEIEAAVSLNGHPRILDTTKVVPLDQFDASASCGIFHTCCFFPATRKKHITHAESLGLEQAPALIDPTAILARSVRVGECTFINAGAIVGAATMIGDAVLVNRGVSIGHHCVVGDYVSIGPSATLASNIAVGAGSVIGVGATILPDVKIGANCVVAGGSVVRADVPDNTFVAGVPAKPKPFDMVQSALFVEGSE